MLTVMLGGTEGFDTKTERFVKTGQIAVNFEHSLASISKWESKHHKPFLNKADKTHEETLDYLRMMAIDDVDFDIVELLDNDAIETITEYISSDQTATTFREEANDPTRETITSELIYYWMVTLQIPFECELWNLGRLMALVKICSIKNAPPKKVNQQDAMRQMRELNAKRRAESGSSG